MQNGNGHSNGNGGSGGWYTQQTSMNAAPSYLVGADIRLLGVMGVLAGAVVGVAVFL